MKYVNKFLRLNCAPDLLSMGLFPNDKEICETMSALDLMYREARKLGFLNTDDRVHVYVLGDGVRPRTGATIAYTSKWSVYSIDPQMRHEPKHKIINVESGGMAEYAQYGQRIWTFSARAENIVIPRFRPTKNDAGLSIILSVHGHADVMAFAQRVKGNKLIIEMPCCAQTSLKSGSFIVDDNIPGPKNVIYWTTETAPRVPLTINYEQMGAVQRLRKELKT